MRKKTAAWHPLALACWGAAPALAVLSAHPKLLMKTCDAPSVTAYERM